MQYLTKAWTLSVCLSTTCAINLPNQPNQPFDHRTTLAQQEDYNLPPRIYNIAPPTMDEEIRGSHASDVFDLTGPFEQIIHAGNRDDIVGVDDGDDMVFGGGGNDVITATSGDNTLKGGPGNDVIYGGEGDNTLYGGKGDDELFDLYGGDKLIGESGADTFNIFAGRGSTDEMLDLRVEGPTSSTDMPPFDTGIEVIGVGNSATPNVVTSCVGDFDEEDRIVCQAYNPACSGDIGQTYLYYDDIIPQIPGGAPFMVTSNADTQMCMVCDMSGATCITPVPIGCAITGSDLNNSPDLIDDMTNNDVILNGRGGADELKSGAGDDILHGGPQDDVIYGQGGTDTIYGGYDNDKIYSSTVAGSSGQDILSGGAGKDTFYIGYSIDGPQTITDLAPGEEVIITHDPLYTMNPTLCAYIGRASYEDIVAGLGCVPEGPITTEVMLMTTGTTEFCAVCEGAVTTTCWTNPSPQCVKFGAEQVSPVLNGSPIQNNYLEDKPGATGSVTGGNLDDTIVEMTGGSFINAGFGDDTIIITAGGESGDLIRGGLGADTFIVANEIGLVVILDLCFLTTGGFGGPQNADTIVVRDPSVTDCETTLTCEDVFDNGLGIMPGQPTTMVMTGGVYTICAATNPLNCISGTLPCFEEGTAGDDTATPMSDGERYDGLGGNDAYNLGDTTGPANFTGGAGDDTLNVDEGYTEEAIFQDMQPGDTIVFNLADCDVEVSYEEAVMNLGVGVSLYINAGGGLEYGGISHPYVVKVDSTGTTPVGQVCEWGHPWNCYNKTLTCEEPKPAWWDGGDDDDTLVCFHGNCTLCGGGGDDKYKIYPTIDGPAEITDLGPDEKIGLCTNDTSNNTVCEAWIGGWEVMFYNLDTPPFAYNVTLDNDGHAKICWNNDEHFCEFFDICPPVHDIPFSQDFLDDVPEKEPHYEWLNFFGAWRELGHVGYVEEEEEEEPAEEVAEEETEVDPWSWLDDPWWEFDDPWVWSEEPTEIEEADSWSWEDDLWYDVVWSDSWTR